MSSLIYLAIRNRILQQSVPVASIKLHGFSFFQKSLKHTLDSSNPSDPQCVTVSYLRNSCGLSSESAILASQKVQLKTTDQPDSVLELLKSIGLDQTHIRNSISNRPMILLADAKKALKPNIDVFGSLGFSGTELRSLLNKDPRILESDAHSVFEVLQDYGFTGKQMFALALKRPTLFVYNGHKNFKPKLEYFKSLGFPEADIAEMLTSEPYILERSLGNQIIPSVEAIRRIVGRDDLVLKVIGACYRILEINPDKVLEPNVNVLINHGVPQSKVVKLLTMHPKALVAEPIKFSEAVEEVDRLGFDPTNLMYILAVRAVALMSKSLWELKTETFRSFGMSGEECATAFKSQPMCMTLSVKKISKMMEFYTNKLKMRISLISKNSNLLLMSLENRVIPRCAVLELLMAKGLVEGNISVVYALSMPNKLFLEKYVNNYLDAVPEVSNAHQGKVQFTGFPIELTR